MYHKMLVVLSFYNLLEQGPCFIQFSFSQCLVTHYDAQPMAKWMSTWMNEWLNEDLVYFIKFFFLTLKKLFGDPVNYLFIFIFLKKFFFIWRMIDLQCSDNFCCTRKWISYIYIHIYIYISPLSWIFLPCPTHLGHRGAPS